MRVLVIGSTGQLGSILTATLNQRGHHCVSHKSRVEEYRFMGGNKLFDATEFDAIINTVAVSNTRMCEANWSNTAKVNVEFPIGLASYLEHKKVQCSLVHISTGCLYNSNISPLKEDASPTPLINYSKQKHVAELCAKIYPWTTILRPRMIFSSLAVPSNLIYKVSKFTELLDEKNSMTHVEDLVNVIDQVIQQRAFGTFNVCNEGLSSPYHIKQMIAEIWGGDTNIKKISKEKLFEQMSGLRLTNTWIDSSKVSSIYKMPPVEQRLREAIKESGWLSNDTK